MSQRQDGFGASGLSSEGDWDLPSNDLSAHNSSVHHNYNPNFEAPSVPSPQITNFSYPFNDHQSPETPSMFAAHPPFSTPSDSQRFSSDPPAVMASSQYIQHLEEFKQAFSNNAPSQASVGLPQFQFDNEPRLSHFSSLSAPLPPPPEPQFSSSSLDKPHLPNGAAVQTYQGEVVWWPSMGMYGVPTTEAEKAFYVKKICLSLVNLSNLYDDHKDLLSYAIKFADTGIWSNPRDIETAAHVIVNNAMRIHNFGVTGVAFQRSEEFESLNSEDMDFTFPQRIHYLARLFWHSKVAADNVMLGRDIAKYVALPFTSLRRLPLFEDEWSSMSKRNRTVHLEMMPYPAGLKHPSRAEQDQLVARVRLLPSLVSNYMATGGHLATLSQQVLSPDELAYIASLPFSNISRKRPADQNEGFQMEPAAKRSHNGVLARSGSSLENPQDAVIARSAAWISGSE